MSGSTKDRIVMTAASLFERYGYASTGLNLIVEESGAPRGSLYYYFPDGKEELAAEAVSYRMAKVAEVWRGHMDTIDDPVEAIYSLVIEMGRVMDASGCDGGAPIATIALEASNSNDRLREACAKGYQQAVDVIAERLVMAGFDEGRAKTLAATVNALIEGAMIMSRAQRDAALMRTVAEDIRVLLQGER